MGDLKSEIRRELNILERLIDEKCDVKVIDNQKEIDTALKLFYQKHQKAN